MLRGLTCKDECTSNPGSSRERLKQNTLNFARIFCAETKNFPAFTAYFFAWPQTCHARAQTYIDLVRACSNREVSPQNTDITKFPIADFSNTGPIDAKRKESGKKRDNSNWAVHPNTASDSTVVVDTVDTNLPGLPVEKAAGVINCKSSGVFKTSSIITLNEELNTVSQLCYPPN
jgi:hypothetical protein